jgi:CBS domain-containing protein
VGFHLNLRTETVQQANFAEPLSVEPDATVRSVLELLKAERRGSVLVCRSGILVGIFTERDALRLMAAGSELDMPVARVMTTAPISVSLRDPVETAITRMAEGGYRRLPVVDESGKPVGILSVGQILHYLVEHFPTYIYNLPPTPGQVTQQREGA